MKKIAIPILIVGFSFLTSCKNEEKKDNETIIENSSEKTEKQEDGKLTDQKSTTDFDINSIPISESKLGDFPYFKLPDGYVFTDPDHYNNGDGKGLTMDYDKEYFLNNGIYMPVEGKTFKGHIRLDDKAKGKVYSQLELQKSFDNLISQMGGVKINNGKGIQTGERDRIIASDPQAQTNGYLSTTLYFDNIHTYVIRRTDYAVWIQYSLNNENGYIAVLKTAEFENKMTLLSSTEIQKELNEKGKAVLHINFDTDKATLKSDGQKAVAEIVKTLQADKNLKIAINGYTDNIGNENHNIELSKSRANTVLNTIVKAGIDKSRLTADGFGSKNPIAENSTDELKAQNRRVELVKK